MRKTLRWNLGLGMVLLAACGGDADTAGQKRGSETILGGGQSPNLGFTNPPPITMITPPQNVTPPQAPPAQVAGMSAPLPPPVGGTGAPPPPPPVGGTGATPPPPPAAAGTGAAGMMGAAGTMSAAGSGGPCTMNLACKLAAPPSTVDLRQDCVDRINQFRTQCACMPPLERWTAAESCADKMCESDSMTGQAHGGFTMRVCTPTGSGQNECPGYRSETQVIGTCLQQMWNEGPPPMTPCTGQCFQTYGHFLNMTNKSFKKVACGFFKTSAGAVWSVQNFSP